MKTKMLFRKQSQDWEKRIDRCLDVWIHNKVFFIPTISFENHISGWFIRVNILWLEITYEEGKMPMNGINCEGTNS